MLPATIKQLVITNCTKIKDLMMHIISSYFLVVSSLNDPRAYFQIFHTLFITNAVFWMGHEDN
tara:strand:- start:2 stop:190 length:189 start_codon:yes stop_codon:yes gene_type:complete